MKITLGKINFRNRVKTLTPTKRINPHAHWSNLLHVFFGIVVLLILFSFFILYKIKNQQIFQIEPKSDESEVLINEKLLENVNKSFDQKQEEEEEIKSGLKSYKDPSL